MEDINFKKFICYILNCIGATENNKLTILYSDKILKKVPYNGDNSKIDFKKLNYTYKDDDAVNTAAGAAAGVADLAAADIPYTILNGDTSEIRNYFNIKEVASYVTDEANANQLNVSKSIFKAFNMIKVFFDAKNWYLKQYRDLQNPISRSGIIFNSDNKRKFYGGTKIEYNDDNKTVKDITYDKLLANVLKDIIYMITDKTEEVKDFDVITLYILSKINYYLAKRYAVLSLNNKKGELHKALEEYAKITEYDTKFFNNFTYYTKIKDGDITNYPRYYQKEILELLKTGTPTDKDDDIKSFALTINNSISLIIKDDTEAKSKKIQDCIKYKQIFDIYHSILQSNTDFVEKYNTFNNFYTNLNKLIDDIITNVKNNAIADGTADAGKTIKESAQKIINDSILKYNIKNDAINTASKINDADIDVTNIKNTLIEEINKIDINIVDHYKNINEMLNMINNQYVAKIFKAIKTYIKKYSNNTFSSVYKSPTISYTVTPMNIRPLIAKRATETDLSNYAAQIASDSFLNSNKLPTIPDFKSIDKVIGLMGGAPDINNSSNVYRTIFNKILNALNAKRIKLNDNDREIVDKKLNDLEEIEQYLKSTLSDYAKYASVTHQKGTVVGNTEIRNFLNDYENKLREYNKKSASVVRFIGRLTPYLYSY